MARYERSYKPALGPRDGLLYSQAGELTRGPSAAGDLYMHSYVSCVGDQEREQAIGGNTGEMRRYPSERTRRATGSPSAAARPLWHWHGPQRCNLWK